MNDTIKRHNPGSHQLHTSASELNLTIHIKTRYNCGVHAVPHTAAV